MWGQQDVLLASMHIKQEPGQEEEQGEQWILEDWGTDDAIQEGEFPTAFSPPGAEVLCAWCALPECMVRLVTSPHVSWLARLLCALSPASRSMLAGAWQAHDHTRLPGNKEEQPSHVQKVLSRSQQNSLKILLPKSGICTPSEYFVCTICNECFKSEKFVKWHEHKTSLVTSKNIFSSLSNIDTKNAFYKNYIEILKENSNDSFTSNTSHPTSPSLKMDVTVCSASEQVPLASCAVKTYSKKCRLNPRLSVRGTKKKKDAQNEKEIKIISRRTHNFISDKSSITMALEKERETKIPNKKLCYSSQVCQYVKECLIEDRVWKNIVCSLCERKSKSFSNFEVHLRLVHMDKIPLFCNLCDNQFRKKQQLVDHVLGHEPSKTSCDLCRSHFDSLSALITHLRREHADWTVFCWDCGRHFITKKELVRHIKKKHPNPNPLSVAQVTVACDKVKLVLDKEQKVYKCALCKYQFSSRRSVGFILHMMKHTNLRPFQCTICDERYINYFNLALHVVTSHCSHLPKSNLQEPNLPSHSSHTMSQPVSYKMS